MDIKYTVAFGFDGKREVVAQMTALSPADHLVLDNKLRSDVPEVVEVQVSDFVSTGHGSERHPDGKDKYRIHTRLDAE